MQRGRDPFSVGYELNDTVRQEILGVSTRAWCSATGVRMPGCRLPARRLLSCRTPGADAAVTAPGRDVAQFFGKHV